MNTKFSRLTGSDKAIMIFAYTILGLLKVSGSWIIIYFNGNLIDTGKRMKNHHVLLCQFHLLTI